MGEIHGRTEEVGKSGDAGVKKTFLLVVSDDLTPLIAWCRN